MKYQIVLTGVGGQGIIFLVKLLARCALNRGMNFIGTETHGMAQKGGTVISYLKIGDFSAPLIGRGRADLMISLYPTEGLRFLHYLRQGAFLVTNVVDEFPGFQDFQVFKVNANERVVKGDISSKSLNVFVLGAALRVVSEFPFSKEEVEKAIAELNPRFSKENIDALNKGFNVF